MRTLQEVIELAMTKHAGQFRRDGKTPYSNHLQDVASRVVGNHLKMIAWLHDILEDTDMTYDELRSWLNEENSFIAGAVKSLTKPHPDCDYFDYLNTVSENSFAVEVKIADLISNLQDNPTKAQITKYGKALNILGQKL